MVTTFRHLHIITGFLVTREGGGVVIRKKWWACLTFSSLLDLEEEALWLGGVGVGGASEVVGKNSVVTGEASWSLASVAVLVTGGAGCVAGCVAYWVMLC